MAQPLQVEPLFLFAMSIFTGTVHFGGGKVKIQLLFR
jgi:hypothetical protein